MSRHVLMFGWEYPPHHSGGLGVACHGIVRGLLQQNTRITLVLPTAAGEAGCDVRNSQNGTLEMRMVHTLLKPYDDTNSFEERYKKATGGGTTLLYGPNMGDAVAAYANASVELTKDVRPDVVHCHDWMTYEAGRRAARYHNVPMVAHIHATELDRTDFRPNPWIAEQERQGLLAADKIIAVSHYTKSILEQHYGIPAHRIAVVHNAHDRSSHPIHTALTSTHATTRPPLVLFLGRMTLQKNPRQFLETACLVHTHRPEVQFVMAGEGPLLGELMEYSCVLGLNECMTFTGHVPHNKVGSLYASANCFVMPSLSEPFGLVALEAISHGVPVVLSKQSGVSEVVEHGFKVDFWDTEKMADCILTILRETPLAEQLTAEAPRVLQRLTWQNQASLLCAVYDHTIAQFQSPL